MKSVLSLVWFQIEPAQNEMQTETFPLSAQGTFFSLDNNSFQREIKQFHKQTVKFGFDFRFGFEKIVCGIALIPTILAMMGQQNTRQLVRRCVQ